MKKRINSMRTHSMALVVGLLLLLKGACLPALAQEDPSVVELSPEPLQLRASIIKTENYPVDLATVLQLVKDQNLVIGQDQVNAKIAKNRYRQSQVSFLPSIDASYAQNWQSGSQRFISGGSGGFTSTGSGGGGRSSNGRTEVQTFIQPQIGASWTLYPGGRTIYEILAARRRKKAADSLLEGTEQEQLAGAAGDYYTLLAAYVQKLVALKGMAEAQEQVKLNETLVDVGKGIPLDLSRAKTTLAQQRTAVVEAENNLIVAEQALLNRLNLDADIHLLPDETETIPVTLVPETLSVDQLIAEATHNNPAMITGEEELKALGFDYKTVRSDLIPSVSLRAFTRGSGSEINDLTRSSSGGLTVNVNLLENMGLKIPLQMQERKKLIEQKVLTQKQLYRDIEQQVMTAFLGSENYEEALSAAQLELFSAKESYELAVGRFRAGYGVNLDVIGAQSDLAAARNTLTQAVLNYNQSQIQLLQAIGQVTPETLVHGITTPLAQGNSNAPTAKP